MSSSDGIGAARAPMIDWPTCVRIMGYRHAPTPANDEPLATGVAVPDSPALRCLVGRIRRAQASLVDSCDGTCGFNIAFGHNAGSCGYPVCPIKLAFDTLERIIETRRDIPV